MDIEGELRSVIDEFSRSLPDEPEPMAHVSIQRAYVPKKQRMLDVGPIDSNCVCNRRSRFVVQRSFYDEQGRVQHLHLGCFFGWPRSKDARATAACFCDLFHATLGIAEHEPLLPPALSQRVTVCAEHFRVSRIDQAQLLVQLRALIKSLTKKFKHEPPQIGPCCCQGKPLAQFHERRALKGKRKAIVGSGAWQPWEAQMGQAAAVGGAGGVWAQGQWEQRDASGSIRLVSRPADGLGPTAQLLLEGGEQGMGEEGGGDKGGEVPIQTVQAEGGVVLKEGEGGTKEGEQEEEYHTPEADLDQRAAAHKKVQYMQAAAAAAAAAAAVTPAPTAVVAGLGAPPAAVAPRGGFRELLQQQQDVEAAAAASAAAVVKPVAPEEDVDIGGGGEEGQGTGLASGPPPSAEVTQPGEQQPGPAVPGAAVPGAAVPGAAGAPAPPAAAPEVNEDDDIDVVDVTMDDEDDGPRPWVAPSSAQGNVGAHPEVYQALAEPMEQGAGGEGDLQLAVVHNGEAMVGDQGGQQQQQQTPPQKLPVGQKLMAFFEWKQHPKVLVRKRQRELTKSAEGRRLRTKSQVGQQRFMLGVPGYGPRGEGPSVTGMLSVPGEEPHGSASWQYPSYATPPQPRQLQRLMQMQLQGMQGPTDGVPTAEQQATPAST